MAYHSMRSILVPGNPDVQRYLKYLVPPFVIPALIVAAVIALAVCRLWGAR